MPRREEQFDEDPDACDHDETTVEIGGGLNTERCLGCGRSWTPPRN